MSCTPLNTALVSIRHFRHTTRCYSQYHLHLWTWLANYKLASVPAISLVKRFLLTQVKLKQNARWLLKSQHFTTCAIHERLWSAGDALRSPSRHTCQVLLHTPLARINAHMNRGPLTSLSRQTSGTIRPSPARHQGPHVNPARHQGSHVNPAKHLRPHVRTPQGDGNTPHNPVRHQRAHVNPASRRDSASEPR